MTWQDVLAVASVFISVAVLLGGALGKETVGELKRRVGVLEARDEARAREVAKLDERSQGMTAALQRIEHQMVPRAEWEAKHAATDAMLERLLAIVERERDSGHQDPPRRPVR
jgi:hypothetical protein